MTGGRIEAFLKLFCITESSHGSWQSWTVLCICLASAIATASSGSYFQRTNAVKSSLVCFIVSAVGFSMALVTLIAILIGCKRRRRISDPEATHGEPTIYANPVISGQSTSIEIEDPLESHSVYQMWMNPVFAEYEKSLYEADWNKNLNEVHGEKDNDTDFDERDSDCFRSSSDTMTWSYNSYSEDEGYFPHSSKERNLKETCKSSLECHLKPLSIFQEALKCNSEQDTSSDLKETDVSSLKRHKDSMSMSPEVSKDRGAHFLEKLMVQCNVVKQKITIAPQNSKFKPIRVSHNIKSGRNSSSSTSCYETEIISDNDLAFGKKDDLYLNYENELDLVFIDDENKTHFQDISLKYEEGTNSADNSVAYEIQNGKRLIKSLKSHNCHVTHVYINRDELLKRFGEKNNSKYLNHREILKSSGQSDECNNLSNSNKGLSSIVKVEDRTKSTESSIRGNPMTSQNVLDSTLVHKARPTINEMSHSDLSHQEKLVKNQSRHKITKCDYPSLPYPIFDEDYSNFKNLGRKEREEFFIPRYEKRPLLDINGAPISQKELVKVITRLLISGLKNIPKNTS